MWIVLIIDNFEAKFLTNKKTYFPRPISFINLPKIFRKNIFGLTDCLIIVRIWYLVRHQIGGTVSLVCILQAELWVKLGSTQFKNKFSNSNKVSKLDQNESFKVNRSFIKFYFEILSLTQNFISSVYLLKIKLLNFWTQLAQFSG